MENNFVSERKIRYDGSVVEYPCREIRVHTGKEAVLYHKIEFPFAMQVNNSILNIPKGSYTFAFYWSDRPYNIYLFRDNHDQLLGLYVNIVKQTEITPAIVTFEDLIIDIVRKPSGEYAVLDEDELPEPLEEFENGRVNAVLKELLDSIEAIAEDIIKESEQLLKKWKKGLL
ncbi:ribonuclease FAU-1 family protein [Gracilibacillus alcaliphilus]|uniref:DUF402 domain-containing protein n=1 Tax=Gracilibacillus alcaliphilus TaxID=1401441 RepID=UPI00195B4FB2|nr:DUF402 domain-containing protein [Gracilibacillus alcaliphilus]MBM7675733.1 putative RNA-binding protein associated with RNAse of E/G family [Gracilibacillus alcaliphilus]